MTTARVQSDGGPQRRFTRETTRLSVVCHGGIEPQRTFGSVRKCADMFHFLSRPVSTQQSAFADLSLQASGRGEAAPFPRLHNTIMKEFAAIKNTK